MKIINPSVEILTAFDGAEVMRFIEYCGRVCYKSESKITDESAENFIHRLIKNKHESVLEHFAVTVKFIIDRAVSHEIVRHRISSYSMESTRRCDYSGDKFGSELTFIKPCFLSEGTPEFNHWKNIMEIAESLYLHLRKEHKLPPEQARSILPNSLKTELIMTMNLRELRHFLKLRTAKEAHPQMREVAVQLLKMLKSELPPVFEDIAYD